MFNDYTVVKKYSDTLFKVTNFNGINDKDNSLKAGLVPSVEDENGRFLSALSRAKSDIFDVAMCNEWEYFGTFTISAEHFDRYNLKEYHKAFSQFIRDERKRTGNKISFVLVPERHKDGAWHEHGLIFGLPADDVRLFTNEDNIPLALKKRIEKGCSEWTRYSNKFGYCTIEPVRDKIRTAAYITKYITKSIGEDRESGEHLYYCSRGLKRPEKIVTGRVDNTELSDIEELFTYSNDFMRTGWVDLKAEKFQGLVSLLEATDTTPEEFFKKMKIGT